MRTILLALGIAVMPLAAEAQYAPCPPNPLAWPFCAAGAVVVGAATIATAPFWILGGAPPYYRGYGYPVPAYYPRRHQCFTRHHRRCRWDTTCRRRSRNTIRCRSRHRPRHRLCTTRRADS